MDGKGILDLITLFVALSFFAYLSRELEIRRIIGEVELYLTLFKAARDHAARVTARKFGELAAKNGSGVIDLKKVESRIQDLLETFVIMPEGMDPFGIVRKVKMVIRTEDEMIKREIRRIVPNAEKGDVEVLAGMIGVSRVLNMVYKVVNHFYVLAKKFRSYWMLLQLDALLPFIAEEVKAYESAIMALTKQVPIGDSVGPLVLATLARELKASPIDLGVKDTRAYVGEYEGRKVILVKAEGPGSSVGRLDEALRRLLAAWGASVPLVITIDAAQKLEGETSGTIAEGYGVAIGGVGVEKFSIEEVLAEYGVRPYALVVKMGPEEALSPLSKELYDAAMRAKQRVKAVIGELTKPGDVAIVIGVGNTLGVGN